MLCREHISAVCKPNNVLCRKTRVTFAGEGSAIAAAWPDTKDAGQDFEATGPDADAAGQASDKALG